MDSLGEVGQKMRSAIKAKLVELGNASEAGYIDDELPDYVMIMVANKRTKVQMSNDLHLFLGSNTETFVNWLHQVLTKLQEVTLPNNLAKATKKKANELADAGKKDKKDKKKDKKSKRKDSVSESKNSTETPTTAASSRPPISSITDVFAVELIEKAKKTLDMENKAKSEAKKEIRALTPSPPPAPKITESEPPTPPAPPRINDSSSSIEQEENAFDIPTITEITQTAGGKQNLLKKELSQLQELQNRIYLAKRKLKSMKSDSEDEDYLNIKDGDDDMEEDDRKSNNIKSRPKQIISSENDSQKKHSVLNRLGVKPTENSKPANIISLSANRRTEKEIYVAPNFRKLMDAKIDEQPKPRERNQIRDRIGERAMEPKKDRSRERVVVERNDRSRDRSRSRDRPNRDERRDRERVREPRDTRDRRDSRDNRDSRDTRETRDSRDARDSRDIRDKKKEEPKMKVSIHQRIGSRVIIAPPKPVYDEEAVEVNVSSVVTVKPRPMIQNPSLGCKNLLLRAMADAQRSTAASLNVKSKDTLRSNDKNELKRPRDNIVVQIPIRAKDRRKDFLQYEVMNEEYIPESVSSTTSEPLYTASYKSSINRSIQNDTVDDADDGDVIYLNNAEDVEELLAEEEEIEEDMDEEPKSPQFVVTLEGAMFGKATEVVNEDNISEKSSKSPTPPPVIKRRSIKDRIGLRSSGRQDEKPRKEKRDVSREKPSKDRKRSFTDTANKSSEESEVQESESQRAYNRAKRSRVSPIKFDLTDEELDISGSRDGSRDPSRDRSRDRNDGIRHRKKLNSDHDNEPMLEPKKHEKRKSDVDEGLENVKRVRKLEPSRNFDHVPAFLSSVAITAPETKSIKTKDRCKFYPICRLGDSCEFFHPTLPCKVFPNCKFGESCAFIHPFCKFDATCTHGDCNYTHTPIAAPLAITPISILPPLASSIVPVQNYKSLTVTPTKSICKFYPNCSNNNCAFFHPKVCMYGKGCNNKMDCNFYHFETSNSKSKFKWISPMS